MLGEEYTRPAHVLRAVTIFVLAVPMVMAANRYLDHHSWLRTSGLEGPREAWRPLLIGMAAWLVPALAALVLFVLAGWLEVSVRAPAGAVALNILALLALVFLFEAFPEELIFRGYIFRNLTMVQPLWLAVAGQALLFAAWGALNGGATTLDRTILFLIFGVLTGMIRAIARSVWASIGYHLAFQTVMQLFGSVGGGQVEASPSLPMLVAFGAIPFALAVPFLRHFYGERPGWRARIPA
jgi:uncharacterized protein